MTTFKVWLRPLGGVCKIKVEGRDNAKWLRDRLGEQGLTCSQVVDIIGTLKCSFHVVCTDAMPPAKLEEFLAGLAEVQLQNDPA